MAGIEGKATGALAEIDREAELRAEEEADRQRKDEKLIDDVLTAMRIKQEMVRHGLTVNKDHLGYQQLHRPGADEQMIVVDDNAIRKVLVGNKRVDVAGMTSDRAVTIIGALAILADAEWMIANLREKIRAGQHAHAKALGEKNELIRLGRNDREELRAVIADLWRAMGRKGRMRVDRGSRVIADRILDEDREEQEGDGDE